MTDALTEGVLVLVVLSTVFDHQFTNSDGCVFNKLVFINWCVLSLEYLSAFPLPSVFAA